MKHALIILVLLSNSLHAQIVQSTGSQENPSNDTSHVSLGYPPIKKMRIVQFGIEVGSQFVNDSAQVSRLNKNNLFHYGVNLQIGDVEERHVFTLIGCDFYATNSGKQASDTVSSKSAIWGISGNLGLRIPLSLSRFTTINFGPSLLLGRHGVSNSNVNTYGIRLAASVEKRIGNFPGIGYLGIAYDNNGLYKRDKSLEKRNLDQLRIYFGLRF